mmetsp:Transcript_23097/g.71991  ORF Transcript_23097/g.71991 Transcript_23097/m.71991 type:complete len:264 (-) Transcript_23097:328-1119(-)
MPHATSVHVQSHTRADQQASIRAAQVSSRSTLGHPEVPSTRLQVYAPKDSLIASVAMSRPRWRSTLAQPWTIVQSGAFPPPSRHCGRHDCCSCPPKARRSPKPFGLGRSSLLRQASEFSIALPTSARCTCRRCDRNRLHGEKHEDGPSQRRERPRWCGGEPRASQPSRARRRRSSRGSRRQRRGRPSSARAKKTWAADPWPQRLRCSIAHRPVWPCPRYCSAAAATARSSGPPRARCRRPLRSPASRRSGRRRCPCAPCCADP